VPTGRSWFDGWRARSPKGDSNRQIHFQTSRTTGHEVLAPNGTIVAWAAVAAWAMVIALLLDRMDLEGLSSLVRGDGERAIPLVDKPGLARKPIRGRFKNTGE